MEGQLAERYADLERWHWWFRGRTRVLQAILRHELRGPAPRSLLSVGCGPATGLGWLVPFVGPHGRVVGLDPEARHAHPRPAHVAFVQGTLEHAPFAPASFDVVLALDVLEHLDDDAAGLRQAVRLVRAGGLLLVTVPALPGLWGAQDVASRHRRRYTKRSLARLFRNNAWPGYRVGYFNTLLFPVVGAVRWSRRAWGSRDRVRSDFFDNRPGLLNEVLAGVFGLERYWINHARIPIGVSLVATSRPPRAEDGCGARGV